MNPAATINGLEMLTLIRRSRAMATACMIVLASISHAAEPLGLLPGVADNKVLGAIANPSAFNTTIASSDISYSNSDLATRTYTVRLPSGYDANNPNKKYGLVTWIDAGGGAFPGSYASALDAHDVIWLSGQGIDNSVATNLRRGVATMGAFRIAELYNIDPARVYTGGLSGGGRVASDLAYLRSDYFRGLIGRVGSSLPGAIPGWECAGNNSSTPDSDYENMDAGNAIIASPLPSVGLPLNFRTAILTQYGDFRRAENMAVYRYGHLNHGNSARLFIRNGGHSDEIGDSFTDALDFFHHPLVDVVWDRFENANPGVNVQAGKTVAGNGFTTLSGSVSETSYSYNSVSHGVLKLTGTGAAAASNDSFTWQNAYGTLIDARLRGETATSANQNEQIGLHIVPAAASGAPADLPGLHVYWCYGAPYRVELVSAAGVRKTLATWEHTATHPMDLAATDKTFWGDTAATDYAGKTKSFRGEDMRVALSNRGFQLTLNRFAANVSTVPGVTLQSSDGSTPYAENIPMVIQGYWNEVETALVNAMPNGNWKLVLTNDAIVPGQPCGNAVVDEIRVIASTGLLAAPATLAVTAPANGQRALTWAQIHGAMAYRIQRSTAPDAGFADLTTVANSASAYTDATASNSGAYYYRVAAVAADGTTLGKWSPVAYAARTGSAPSAPSAASVTYPASYQVRLAWTDNANNETGFRIERSPSGTAQWTVVAAGLAANSDNHTDTVPRAGMTYDYRISAYGTAGISGYAAVSATPTDVAPPAPGGVAATVSSNSVALTWNAMPEAASFKVKRATAPGGPFTTIASGLTTPAFIDTTFPVSGLYYYVVTAMSGGSLESAPSPALAVSAVVLPAPANLTVTPGYGANSLTWSAAYDANSYIIRRATSAGGPYTIIATDVVGDFFADPGLTTGTAYFYTVQSVAGSAVSALTGPASGTPIIRQSSPSPAAPVTGSNLLIHLDASNAATITKDGSNKVSRWNDASAGTNYAAQATAANQATALTDANGIPQIDFGSYVVNSTGAWMQFKNPGGSDVSFSTIRSVFAVMKGANFLLGDGGNYHFHRGGDIDTAPLWSSSYTSGNILGGSTRLNGDSTPINGVSTAMPSSFWLASVQTAGNVTAGRLANDRNARTGGQQIAEVLVYNRTLTDTERAATESYLMRKWFGIELPAPFTAPQITQQPAALDLLAGSPATFSVTATGRANTFQWRKNGAAIAGANAATFTIPAVQASDAGSYDVVVVNPAGTVTSSAAELTTYTDLAPPSGLAVALVGGEITATWNAVAGATSYNLLRSRTSGSGFTTIASGIAGTSHTDTGAATTGGTYYYKVSSNNATGTGPGSAPAAIVLPDTTPPVLPALNNLVIEATGPAGAAASFSATATDAVDGAVSISYSPASGATFPLGESTVTASATDAAGNNASTSFTVTVRDTTPPVITTPGNIYRTSFSGAVPVVFNTTATDVVSGSRPTLCTPASGSVFPVGTTTVTVSSADAAGNTATTTFEVTVGNSVPVQSNLLLRVDASLPSSIVKDASNKVSRWNDADGRSLYFAQGGGSQQPTASTDATLGKTVVDFGVYSENSGSPSASMQLNDGSGASASLSTIRTVFAVMKGSNFLLGDGGGFDFHRGGAAATSPLWDGGFASANIRNGRTYLNAGTTAINGTTTAMPSTYWLASVVTAGNVTASRLANDRGLRTGGQQIAEVAIYDRALTDSERKSVEAYLTGKWFGSDATALTITASNVTAEATGPDGAVVVFNPTATNTLDGSVPVACSPVSGSRFPLGISSVTATATNSVGYSTSTAFSVTVQDTTAPAIDVPADMIVDPAGSEGAAVNFTVTASDLVDGPLPVSLSHASGSTFPIGTTTVTASAGDLSGNTGSRSFTITVRPPVPGAPTGLSATPAFGQVALSWTAASYATSYQVKRATVAGGPYTTVASETGLSYTDSGLPSGSTRYYIVSAVNITGTADSAEVSATPPGGTFQKANNTTALDQGASWTLGSVPNAFDTAKWDGTYTSGVVGVGAGVSVKKLQLASPSTSITINTGTGPLTLGDGGIDMSVSTQSLTVNAPVILAASQAWPVAGGRSLYLNDVVADGGMARDLALAGTGSVVLAANNTYGGTTALSAGTLHFGATAGSTSGSVAGPLTLGGGTLRSNRTDSHSPIGGAFTATAGTIQVNSATSVFTLNSTNLPAGSSNAFTTLTGVSGATFVVDGAPTASLAFGGSVGGMSLTVKNGAVNFTTNGGSFNFRIEGGSFTSTPTDRFQLATANQTFTVTGGTVNLTAGTTYGFRLGGGNSSNQGGAQKVTGTQSGGNVSVATFNMGGTDTDATKSPSYSLSGGTLSTTGNMSLGADTIGNGSSTFTLSGSGKLKVPGSIAGAQANANAKQIFAINGGTLVAATVNATNLRPDTASANGTLLQSAGTLAPGDTGTAGKTAITGGYNLGASGTLAIDIGGTTQATAYQTGQYDCLTVSTTTALAGNLSVKLINGFTPSSGQSFTILNSTGTLSGAFGNVAFGSRITTASGEGTFLVTQSGNTVVLSAYQPALTPLQSWREQYFGTSANTGTAADTFDADFDGLENLLEYALCTIPTSAASAARPALATVANHLTLTFNRIADPAIIYQVEAGPDLAADSWSSIWQSTGVQNTAGPVTVTDSTHDINTSNPPRRFLRLRVFTP
jgi:autotransporter-associated beta strand protein